MSTSALLVQKFKEMPFEDKTAFMSALEAEVSKASSPEKQMESIERKLTVVLVDNWNKTATAAINSALASFTPSDKPFTKKDSDKVLSRLDKGFKGVEKATAQRLENDIRRSYEINKKYFINKFELKKVAHDNVLVFKGRKYDVIKEGMIEDNRIIKSANVLNFPRPIRKIGIEDQFIWENISRLANIAIGDHFPVSLKPYVTKSLADSVIGKGMNRAQANEYLKNELTRVLGGDTKGALPKSFQSGQARTNAYFDGLNVTNMTMAHNFSQVSVMADVGITQVVYVAIIDNLTSEICLSMDGRVFTIDQATAHMNNILNAKDVSELKNIAPFTRNLDSFGLGRGVSLTNAESSDALAKAGVIMPPLHFYCRSSIEPY